MRYSRNSRPSGSNRYLLKIKDLGASRNRDVLGKRENILKYALKSEIHSYFRINFEY
jgi:hypothetical protein